MSEFEIKYREIIEKIDNAPVFLSLIKLRDIEVPLIIYGTGEQAKLLLSICHKYSIKVSGFADSSKSGNIHGLNSEVMNPDELVSLYPNAIILIGSWKYNMEIYKQLLGLGFSEEKIVQFPFSHPYIISSDVFASEYLEGYKRAYDFFEDGLSKQIILDRIAAYMYDKPNYRTSNAPKYFDFSFSNKEVFVQAGTYCGETVKEFLELFSSNSNHIIYTFEADPQAFEISKKELSKYVNVHLVNKGLWSSETVLTFHTDALSGSASFVNGNANETQIPVTSLDSFFENKGLMPTFIQFDIEGAELEALKGARKIIGQYCPKLAICVYHKYEDVYSIPEMLFKYNPNYKFCLQQCEDGIYDTILYAY